MKKKVMLLMLVLPLLFMLTIFTVSKAVSIIVSVPVSGIKITTQNDEGLISVDMATYDNDLYLTAEVLPVGAKNKNYTVSVSGVGDEAPADIVVAENGLVTINGVGRAKVTVTSNENAFSDSVIISATSSKVLDFTPTLFNASGTEITLSPSTAEGIDYEADVYTGNLSFGASVYPANLSESAVTWQSENERLTLNEITGKGRALLSGESVVTAVNADGIDGEITKKIKLNVTASTASGGVLVNGAAGGNVLCNNDTNTLILICEKTGDGEVAVDGGAYLEYYELEYLDEARTQFRLTLTFTGDHPEDVSVSIGCGGNTETTTFFFADFAFGVYTPYHLSEDDDIFIKNGKSVTFTAASELSAVGVTYRWSVADESVLRLSATEGNIVTVTALKTGNSALYVTALKNGVELCDVEKSVTSVTPVSEINFTENNVTYGISDVLAVGSKRVNGYGYTDEEYRLAPKLKLDTETYSPYANENFIAFTSSNTAAATVKRTVTQTKLSVEGTGSTTVTAKWIYADYFKESVSATLTLNTVKDGVNVSSYADLKKATDDGYAVVLTADIMLGKQNASAAELLSMTKSMPTTWDWQYYDNAGAGRPSVYYLIEFKNDVYGNGFEINGDYITQAVDGTGLPLLFKGPLDFVDAKGMASVKGQDNIVFLVKKPVTIDNVELKGCSDESLINENGDYDLSRLNYTGTTLEIAASVTLKNSRVSNGRTVMRVFGGGESANGKPVVASAAEVTAADEKINVLIESCILTGAREFILKMGSNRALLSADGENPAKLPTANGGEYLSQNAAANFADEYFVRQYVTTDVTLKNSVLATSGLFAVGVETHFAGPMLNGNDISIEYWKNLIATSYASVLHLVGDVRILDWKNLDNVDSSTLIEVSGDAGSNWSFLKMDIAAMLEKVAEKPEYSGVVTESDGQKYVHGGIAVYGGGYNYALVDTSAQTSEAFNNYIVNLNVLAEGLEQDLENPLYLQGTMLPAAAGAESFRFYMYGADSETNYEKQTADISSGAAYKIIPALSGTEE